MSQSLLNTVSPLDTKESVLKFIQVTDLRKAPNPPKYIHKEYLRKTKSSISWDDFIRLIHDLETDGYLLKSQGPHEEDCYFPTAKANDFSHYESVKSLEFERLNLEVEELRNKVLDYPEVRQRSKTAELWSIVASVSAGLTLILMLLQWMCNKPG